VAVDTRSAWVQNAETAVTALRGVEAVRILADGDVIREIHVLSTSNRPAKQIVRDVQSVLLTRFGREIDYRVVSVAYCEPSPGPRAAPGVPPASAAEIETAESRPPLPPAPAVAATPTIGPPSAPPAAPVRPPVSAPPPRHPRSPARRPASGSGS